MSYMGIFNGAQSLHLGAVRKSTKTGCEISSAVARFTRCNQRGKSLLLTSLHVKRVIYATHGTAFSRDILRRCYRVGQDFV